MKKRANINFILAMVLVLAMMIVPIGLGLMIADLSSGTDTFQSDLDVALGDGEVDDVEGYGLIAEGIGHGFSAFAEIILLVVIFMVGGYAFLLLLFALIARLVFAREGKRLLAYRILMGFEYVLQAGVVLFFCDMLIGSFSIGPLVLMLLVLAGLVYSARNTYTKRICE